MSKSATPEKPLLKGTDSCPAEIDTKTEQKPPCKRLIPFKWDRNAIEKWLSVNPIPNRPVFSLSASSAVSKSMITTLQKTLSKFGSPSFESEEAIREKMRQGFMNENFADINYSHFTFPDKDWRIVRPHEFERVFNQYWKQKDKLRLPAVPSKTVFYINKQDDRAVWEMPDELKYINGVKVLAEDHRLLAHQKELIELIYTVANYSFNFNIEDILDDQHFCGFVEEKEMLEIFDARKNVETEEKKQFSSNYLLMDPNELKTDAHGKVPFHRFIQSIFYIGKTSTVKERPFNHLKNTFERSEIDIQQKYGASFKRNRIQKIWQTERGVIVLLIFTNIDEREAEFREACMIRARMGKNNFLREFIKQPDTKAQILFNMEITEYWKNTILGPIDLTNKKDELTHKMKAESELSNWSDLNFTKFGCRLLFRAFGIFRLERKEEIFETAFKFKKPAVGSSKRGHSSSESDSVESTSTSPRPKRPAPRSSPLSRRSSLPLSPGQTTLNFANQ